MTHQNARIPLTREDFEKKAADEETRMMQCPARRQGGCGLLDCMLGWRVGMPLSQCDQCYELGGPNSEKAKEFHQELATQVLVRVMGRPLGDSSDRTVKAILTKWTPPPEQKEKLLKEAPSLGVGRAVKIADELFPEDKDLSWSIIKQGGELPGSEWDKLSGRSRWNLTKHTWEEAQKKLPPPVSRVRSFVRALWSRLGGKTEDAVYSQRWLSCTGLSPDGKQIQEPCPALKSVGGKKYCGECGCRTSPISELNTKLTFPQLECPRRRPGFSNATLTVGATNGQV